MGGLLTKRPQFPSEHMTKTKYLGMKCSGERNQTHTCSKQEPCCEVIVARSSAPLRPKTWLLFMSSVMYSQFCSINDKKANSTCAFLLWFYFFPLLMWKRNLLIYDCTLQHYIHIRKYIKKKINPVQNTFHMLQNQTQTRWLSRTTTTTTTYLHLKRPSEQHSFHGKCRLHQSLYNAYTSAMINRINLESTRQAALDFGTSLLSMFWPFWKERTALSLFKIRHYIAAA